MKRLLSLCACVPAIALLAACGGGEVVVLAQIEREASADGDAGPLTLSNLPIFILPYDRDAIFDSLEAAYPEPEPPIPDTLLTLQSLISTAQREFQQAENDWAVIRDSLQALNDRMSQLSRTSAEYNLLYRDFLDLETQVNAAERASQQAFQRFTSLQDEFTNMSQAVRVARDEWADRAFADINTVIAAKLDALGREEYADTTGTDGVISVVVPPGQWWVHARYPLPFDELYWNVPIQVARGERVELQLSRNNAMLRPRL